MHYIYCVSGYSGTGKDEFCRRLVKSHGAIHTGMVDPAKRHMADIYGWGKDQLFGPSEMRNAGDPRYPKLHTIESEARRAEPHELILDPECDSYTDPEKNWWIIDLSPFGPTWGTLIDNLNLTIVWGSPSCVLSGTEKIRSKRIEWPPNGNKCMRIFFEDGDPKFFLSPREALQQHCDKMNQLYPNTWIEHGVSTHRKLSELLLATGIPRWSYDRMNGIQPNCEYTPVVRGHVRTCFSDFRHWNEIKYVRKAAEKLGDFIPVLIRVKRPGIEKPPFRHKSETEQASIPDSEFDFVVDNKGTIEDLHETVDIIVEKVEKA